MSNLSTYRETAHEQFNHLTGNMDEQGVPTTAIYPDKSGNTSYNYWQIGNTFDTITDYLKQDAEFPVPKVNKDQTRSIICLTYEHYRKMTNSWDSNGCWYDDFGWWGIACSKAFRPEYENIFGNLKLEYQQIALSSWDIFNNGKYDDLHHGAPNGWKTCDQKTFANCNPRFPGGVWQYDMFADYRPKKRDGYPSLESSGSDPSTPIDIVSKNGKIFEAVNLGPFQNTVVNGLYFVLANKMKAIGWEKRETVDKIYNFFYHWIYNTSLTDIQRLNKFVTNGQLIRERVSTYGLPYHEYVHWYDSKTAWSGDQGLVLGALAEYGRNNNEIQMTKMITEIMKGMASSVVKTDGSYRFLMPWYPLDNNKLQTADPGDYSSGLGVFMRYLGEAYEYNKQVQQFIGDESSPFRKVIFDTANTVAHDKLPKWDDGGIFDSFNRLAVMVMAIKIVKC